MVWSESSFVSKCWQLKPNIKHFLCYRNLSLPVIGRATNNTAEIQACVHALKICHQAGKCSFRVDFLIPRINFRSKETKNKNRFAICYKFNYSVDSQLEKE